MVLPTGVADGLSDTTDRELVAVPDFLPGAQQGPLTFTWPGDDNGEESTVLRGFFACGARIYSPHLDALPNVIVVRHDPQQTP